MTRPARRHRSAVPVLLALYGAIAAAPGSSAAQQRDVSGPALPMASPAEVGLDADALARIGPAMQAMVDAGRVPGVMTMVARHGRIAHWETVGVRDLESGEALGHDDLFRIFSMTKPVTSVAIMMLVENGDLSLDDPLSDHLPEFADVKVYRADGEPTPPSRPITIRHLLSHNGGLTYGFFGNSPVDQMYMSSDLFAAPSLEEFVSIAASLPLVADPGTEWNYSVSTDILGRVVEVVSGQTFPAFLEEKIFRPLGMDDTAFWVPENKRDRFTTRYATTGQGLQAVDSPTEGDYLTMPGMASGGGGLASTASDYIRFAQMLLDDGELDGVRILEAETVRAMRTNVLPASLTPISLANWFQPGYGFGLGFATLMDADATDEADHTGTYRWGGIANTFFWIDPEADLIAMVWTQLDPFLILGLERSFQALVYDALQN